MKADNGGGSSGFSGTPMMHIEFSVFFSYKWKILCKINEFEFEINCFGQIHPTTVKAKGDTNPHEPQFNFSFDKKKQQTTTQIRLCKSGSNGCISTKRLHPRNEKKTSRKSSCLNWGNGKSDIQPNCCSFFVFLASPSGQRSPVTSSEL